MSCLFDSLSPSVGIHPKILRKAIVAYLRTNPQIMDDLRVKDVLEASDGWGSSTDLESYADHMSNEQTWGGAIEVKAFCELFKMNIVVHVSYTNKTFEVLSSKPARKIVHIHYNGSHFTPLYSIIAT